MLVLSPRTRQLIRFVLIETCKEARLLILGTPRIHPSGAVSIRRNHAIQLIGFQRLHEAVDSLFGVEWLIGVFRFWHFRTGSFLVWLFLAVSNLTTVPLGLDFPPDRRRFSSAFLRRLFSARSPARATLTGRLISDTERLYFLSFSDEFVLESWLYS